MGTCSIACLKLLLVNQFRGSTECTGVDRRDESLAKPANYGQLRIDPCSICLKGPGCGFLLWLTPGFILADY